MVEANNDVKHIVVTGGNAGIGKALCMQLAGDFNCHVYMGSRSLERGAAAVKDIETKVPACAGKIEVVQIDTCSNDSIVASAAAVKAKLGEGFLYAIVNNAGVASFGLNKAAKDNIITTNVHGPKLMTDAYLPLICPKEGRIVNVGSGAGPGYVRKLPK
jgi:NAD(P)-dependent dehydrogenase (short-subunit alcohol dehydrogenase family)